jgi:hypothetical protein
VEVLAEVHGRWLTGEVLAVVAEDPIEDHLLSTPTMTSKANHFLLTLAKTYTAVHRPPTPAKTYTHLHRRLFHKLQPRSGLVLMEGGGLWRSWLKFMEGG